MRARPNPDYKGRRKVSGHKGRIIFSPIYLDSDGEEIQYLRHMPSHYNDAKTERQQVERNDMTRVMKLHRILRDSYQDCFEGKGKSYTRFISHNRNAHDGQIIISNGSLPTLNYIYDGHNYIVDIIADDWQEGDELRHVHATIDGVEYFAMIHMRKTPEGYLVSSQELIPLVPMVETIWVEVAPDYTAQPQTAPHPYEPADTIPCQYSIPLRVARSPVCEVNSCH